MRDPIAAELAMTAEEIAFGQDVTTAVINLHARVGQDDLLFFVTAVSVQSQTGGNLAEVLARLATLMRQRSTLQLKVKALSAEGRLSAWFLSAMPFILYGAVRLLSKDYFAELTGSAGSCSGAGLRRGVVGGCELCHLPHGQLQDLGRAPWISGSFCSCRPHSFRPPGITFSVGHLITSRNRLQRRLPAGASLSDALALAAGDDAGALAGESFQDDRFGLGERIGKELRLKLVRAGYFSPRAVRFYVSARVGAVIAAPSLVLLGSAFLLRDLSTLRFVLAAAVSVGVGVLGPDAYLSRRQSWQIAEYRLNFPDLLDLLTVCVTAGLTVESSFERIRDRLMKRSWALGRNIELMGAEMRAGRSSVDALSAFADRLGLDEAASFVGVLRHSVELGGDVATTLREFSEDMRSKRMLLAEKKANELPVKMVIPLALGIFPVILMIVLLPVILKLLRLIGS